MKKKVFNCLMVLLMMIALTAEASLAAENTPAGKQQPLLYQAFDEIQGMIDEMNAAEKKHESVLGGYIFYNLLFMKCYYRKVGIPQEEFGKSVYRVGGEYGVTLSEISDIN